MTEPTDELPKWVAWLAWGVGALSLFAVLLGRSTLDAIDGEYPRRDEVRDKANEGKPIAIEVGDGAEQSEEIRDALSVLPEMLTILAEQKKARVVLTTLESIKARGIEPGLPASHVAGYFLKDGWQIYIAHDADKAGMVALHEFGHFVDAALDECSAMPTFHSIYQAAVERGELGAHYMSAAAEMFAYMFSQHFFSDRRRARLAEDYPEGSAFFYDLVVDRRVSVNSACASRTRSAAFTP